MIENNLKVKCEEPMILYFDDKSPIKIVHNWVKHDRTKHFIKKFWTM